MATSQFQPAARPRATPAENRSSVPGSCPPRGRRPPRRGPDHSGWLRWTRRSRALRPTTRPRPAGPGRRRDRLPPRRRPRPRPSPRGPLSRPPHSARPAPRVPQNPCAGSTSMSRRHPAGGERPAVHPVDGDREHPRYRGERRPIVDTERVHIVDGAGRPVGCLVECRRSLLPHDFRRSQLALRIHRRIGSRCRRSPTRRRATRP